MANCTGQAPQPQSCCFTSTSFCMLHVLTVPAWLFSRFSRSLKTCMWSDLKALNCSEMCAHAHVCVCFSIIANHLIQYFCKREQIVYRSKLSFYVSLQRTGNLSSVSPCLHPMTVWIWSSRPRQPRVQGGTSIVWRGFLTLMGVTAGFGTRFL